MAGKTAAGSAMNRLTRKAKVWIETHRIDRAESVHISRFWRSRVE